MMLFWPGLLLLCISPLTQRSALHPKHLLAGIPARGLLLVQWPLHHSCAQSATPPGLCRRADGPGPAKVRPARLLDSRTPPGSSHSASLPFSRHRATQGALCRLNVSCAIGLAFCTGKSPTWAAAASSSCSLGARVTGTGSRDHVHDAMQQTCSGSCIPAWQAQVQVHTVTGPRERSTPRKAQASCTTFSLQCRLMYADVCRVQVLLFTDKDTTPPLLQALSANLEPLGLLFADVHAEDKEVLQQFGVDKVHSCL